MKLRGLQGDLSTPQNAASRQVESPDKDTCDLPGQAAAVSGTGVSRNNSPEAPSSQPGLKKEVILGYRDRVTSRRYRNPRAGPRLSAPQCPSSSEKTLPPSPSPENIGSVREGLWRKHGIRSEKEGQVAGLERESSNVTAIIIMARSDDSSQGQAPRCSFPWALPP